MKDLSYDILVELLEEPSPYKSQEHANRYAFNCPHCAVENGGFPDNKYNLEVNLDNHQFHCWKCSGYSSMKGPIRRLFYELRNFKLLKSYDNEYKHKLTNVSNKKQNFILELPEEFEIIEIGNIDKKTKKFYDYLIGRKISEHYIEKYKIGYCYTGYYAGCLIFPSFDENYNLNGFIAKNVYNESYMIPFGLNKNKIIFWENCINWDKVVFIVEGVFDGLSVYNAIPLLGKSLKKNYKLLNTISMKANSDVIIAIDEDVTQQDIEEIKQAITSNSSVTLKRIDLKGYKDLNKLKQDNPDMLTKLIKSSYII
jgi:hypothetical protein